MALMPDLFLSDVSIGRQVRLLGIQASVGMAHRLAELGLTPGITMTVIQTTGGPVLISVRNSRIALGKDIARQLRVDLISG